MISITKLFEDPSEASQDNVDEGVLGDIGHTIRQRTPFRRKPINAMLRPGKYDTMNRRRSESGISYGGK